MRKSLCGHFDLLESAVKSQSLSLSPHISAQIAAWGLKKTYLHHSVVVVS